MSTFGQPLYGESSNNTEFFLTRLIESLPANYVPPETLDFMRRFLLPSAEDLDYVNNVFDLLDTYVFPNSAPEEWVRWMLTEWLGWTLIPEGYPLARLRRLLADLHQHYKRRGTREGLRLLLAEFGAIGEVIDRPLYVGSWIGMRGISGPLNVWVRIFYLEPWESAPRTFVGNYIGNLYVYRTTPLVTKEFCYALCEWSRAAGTRQLIEFVTRRPVARIEAALYDQPVVLDEPQPISSPSHITEP